MTPCIDNTKLFSFWIRCMDKPKLFSFWIRFLDSGYPPSDILPHILSTYPELVDEKDFRTWKQYLTDLLEIEKNETN